MKLEAGAINRIEPCALVGGYVVRVPRSMRRLAWRALHRQLRVLWGQQQKAALELVLYGSSSFSMPAMIDCRTERDS